jgi:hypothetical protein
VCWRRGTILLVVVDLTNNSTLKESILEKVLITHLELAAQAALASLFKNSKLPSN